MGPGVWAILLLLAGLLLIVTEVFTPSGGLIGIAAAACFAFSILFAWQAWWGSHTIYFWLYVAGMSVAIPTAAVLAFRVWPNTPLGRKAILVGPTREEVIPFQEEEAHLRELIGEVGIAATVLNPAGMMRLENERLHCQSEGMILDAGTPVRIIAVQGNRVIVRRHILGEARNPLPPSREPEPLDFDLS